MMEHLSSNVGVSSCRHLAETTERSIIAFVLLAHRQGDEGMAQLSKLRGTGDGQWLACKRQLWCHQKTEMATSHLLSPQGDIPMCFDDDSHPPMPLSDGSSARGEEVTLHAADGSHVMAYVATSDGPLSGQVVVLPDVRGLHNFYRELALRFADVGVRAIVIDYFARTAADATRDDSFDYMPHVEQMTPGTFRQDLEAAVTYLRSREGERLPTFTVGFCMGGSLSFYTGSLGLGLQGVIGFYAGLRRTRGAVTPVLGFFDRIEVPLLGLFGGADQGIPQEDVSRFEHALDRAGKEHEIVVYPGAPHSFFDRKAAEFAAASADAWSRVQGFIADHGVVRV